MKRVEVIIERTKLEEFKHAFDGAGIKSIMVVEVKERDQRPGYAQWINGVKYNLDFLPKIKLDVILEEALLDRAVEVVAATAKSENLRDVTVFVSTVDGVIHIRPDDKEKSYTDVLASFRPVHAEESWHQRH